nr:sulfate adenylyltransferase [Deinobacterium chartae]
MPAPLGGTLVWQVSGREAAELAHLPRLELNARGMADLEMIATGAYSPLRGFMNEADYRSVVERMRLHDGTPWSVPVTLPVPGERARELRGEVALTHHGRVVGRLQVSEQYRPDKDREALEVYRTRDETHPGVAALRAAGAVYLAGEVELLALPRGDFPAEHLTPHEARAAFAARGWRSVVAFQTRNPIHRAHEYLHKVALELVDGLFLHPLVGATKSDDVPASVRMRAYGALLQHYYPAHRVLLGVYPAAMRYAGPREAVLHALSRRNYGCTHFIVGRDHAGVGNYYGTYDAQEIFSAFGREELGIEILRFEHTFYCKTCGAVASRRSCPHGDAHHVALSGTRVRDLLRAGEPLPPEFSRPEVAEVLRSAYRDRS